MQYIHGQANNPIYKIAKENKLIEPKYNRLVNDDDDDSDDDEDTEYNEGISIVYYL